MNIRIMIADDHPIVREGLKQLLELEDDFKIIGSASNGKETIDLSEKLKPDVLLLDINFPDISGLEVLRRLKKNNSNMKIVMLTIHGEAEYLVKAMENGCDGYVLKDSDSDVIGKAIRMAHNCGKYVQPSLVPVLNAALVKKNSRNGEEAESLTERERDVLVYLSMGMQNKEIADKLNISERTVKNHVSHIFKKIDVSDRTQAALFAVKNNLISIK